MGPYRDIGTFDGPSGFEGAIGKITRARWQLLDLHERFVSFLESQPYSLRREFVPADGMSGEYRFVVESVSVPKREWGVLIGEVVHNLRSALDHAAYAASANPDRHTHFPAVLNSDDWPVRADKALRTVPPSVRAYIETIQPFQRPQEIEPRKHLLSVLYRLSNHDKHRMLTIAVMALEGMAPRLEFSRDVHAIREIRAGFGRLEVGETLLSLRIERDGEDPEINLSGDLEFAINFTDPAGRDRELEGRSVEEVLGALYSAVKATVIQIEFICKGLSDRRLGES